MKRFASILIGLVFSSSALLAQTSAQHFVITQATQEPLKGSTWGIYAKDASGKVLVSHNAGTRLMPASNRKLITTGVALHALGPDFRFRTSLGYTGVLQADGTLDGDVYIIGGGDPTIGTQDTTIALKADALFWKWKNLLREKGIKRIHGRIIGDGTSMEGLLEHPSWEFDDMGTYYGTGGNALCFYENTIDMRVSATREGQLINLTQVYPETPWLHVTNFGVTGPEGSGNTLYLYTTDLAPYAEMRGVFGVDRLPKIESTSNKYGALTCAYYFWQNLLATGWEVTGGYAHVDRSGYIQGPDFVETDMAATPKVIGYTESPRLADIARITNERSDNFYAESMLRYMGEKATGVAEYDSCLVAESMVSYLEAIQKSPSFDAFLASLPKPGEGTLASIRFPGSDRVRMKSGSLSGTLCYSGYILDDKGKPAVTFSILTNSSLATASQVRPVLMQMVRRLME